MDYKSTFFGRNLKMCKIYSFKQRYIHPLVNRWARHLLHRDVAVPATGRNTVDVFLSELFVQFHFQYLKPIKY